MIIILWKLTNPEAITTQLKLITEKLFAGFTHCLEKRLTRFLSKYEKILLCSLTFEATPPAGS